MNTIIGLVILIIAVAIIEIDDFRFITVLLGILGGLFTVGALLDGVYIEILPLAVYSIVLLPLALFIITVYTKPTEEPPLLQGILSSVVLVVLIIISYVVSLFVLGVAGIEWSLILIGIFGLVVKTDIRKTVASLSLLVYSVHLLTPGFDIVIEGVLMLTAGILVLVLLILGYRYFVLRGSMSTRELMELKL
ncbi:hypothetical protein E2P64_09330 [Candidatus Bathyarchaeota archaeon]|nr:hypothetical protein E2P64_09330 [Candidatus Bathyarchaeota archaeon]